MGKEVADMSTDEESDCVVICPPNGDADHEEVVSGSHDEDSPETLETPHTVDSNMDNNGQEDMAVSQDSPKLIHQQESSLPNSPAKPVIAGQLGSSHTVPEPCSSATVRRSSGAGNCSPVAHPTSSGEKLSDKSSTSTRSMAKKSPSVTPRKPLQSDNTSHSQDDDSYSVTSSTVTSARAGKTKKTTVPVAPTFVCVNRAEKRGETPPGGASLRRPVRSSGLQFQVMDLPFPRWKKGKDGKDFAALAAATPMSSIVAELQASLRPSESVAILSNQGGDALLLVAPEQAGLLNRAAFGRAVEIAGEERQWFQLGPEEVFFLSHALDCITVESADRKQMDEGELWDHLCSASEPFPEMYKAYQHLRSKNWVVRSGLQYGADYVAYRHHPALVHSEFAVIVVPEGDVFGTRCGRMKVWSDLLCSLRASGSVAKTLLLLTISSRTCELTSPDCLQQLIVHERTITRWIPQQCREQRQKPCREEAKPCGEDANMIEQGHTRESVGSNYWSLILGFTVLTSLIVYRLKF